MTYRMRQRTRLIAAAAASIALVGAAWAGAAPDQAIDDTDITRAVETELAVDDAVRAHLVDVATHDGIVTLAGQVDHLLARQQAEMLAESTTGVRSVVNRLTVKPVRRSDRDIRRDVEQALLDDPAADSYKIDVTVDRGAVSLAGVVSSGAERRLAERVAAGVRGVRSVINRITVELDPDRTDMAIAADIRGRLEASVWVDDALVNVEVTDGRVVLSGSVASAAERRRAIGDAWVAGVTDIDAEDLKVAWWMRDQMRRVERYTSSSDAEVRAAIEDALTIDPRVYSFNVDTSVDRGIVTLTGTVDNLEARRAAERDAENTIGVRRVINAIRVRPAEIPDDETLAQRVRRALARDPYVSRFDVDVTAMNGRVYLSGTVNNSFEKDHAELVAGRLNGVVEVENGLRADVEWSWKPDREIVADVESQLFWSPFVDADDVAVTVDDGVVTLTGTVETWSEWNAAAENAFEGGARDVRNRLEVAFD